MSGTTSYRVQARLTITGNAQEVLRQLGRSLTSLDRRLDSAAMRLSSFAGAFDKVRPHVGTLMRLSVALRHAQTETQNMAAASRGLQRASSGLNASTAGLTRRLNAQLPALQGQTAAANAMATAMGAAAGQAAHLRSSIARMPRVPRSALAAATAAAGGAAAGGGGAGGAGGAYVPLWRRVAGGAASAAAGAAIGAARVPFGAVGAGYLGLHGVGRLLTEGGELQTEGTIAREQLGPAAFRDLPRLRARAEETTRLVPGTNIAGNLRAGMELRTAIPRFEEVLEALPQMQRIAQMLEVIRGEGAGDRAAASLGRSLNLRGAIVDPNDQNRIDVERYRREAELMGRNMLALRGLRPEEFQNFFQQARSAGQNLTERSLYGGFTASGIQAMGGHRFGTGLAAFVRQFQVGTMTNQQAATLRELGLIAPKARAARVPEATLRTMQERGELTQEEFESLRTGGAQQFSRRDMRFADLASADPEAWLAEILPGLQRRRFRGQQLDMANPRIRDALAQGIGGTEVSRGFLSWLFDTVGRQADVQAVQAVQPGAAERILTGSYAGGLNALSGGFRSLLQTIGESPEVVRLLNDTGAALRDLATALKDQGGVDALIGKVREAFGMARQGIEDIAVVAGRLRAILSGLGLGGGPLAPESPIGQMRALTGRLDSLRGQVDSLGGILRPLNPAPQAAPALPSQEAAPPSWGGSFDPRDVRRQSFSPAMPRDQHSGRRASPSSSGRPDPFMPMMPPRGDTIIHTHLHLDGRPLAVAVSRIQGEEASRPVNAAAGFDRRRALLLPDAMVGI